MPAKSIPIAPVTGFMDLRSEPDSVPVGGYRYVQNMQVVQKNKLCRMPGWTRLMDRDTRYNNQDFRDQLQSLTGQSTRLPVTFMFEAESSLKQTKLILSTAEFVMALNVGTGNYRRLSSTFGNVKSAAQTGDTIVLTNDEDPPRYWVFDSPDLALIPDLQKLGITRVGNVLSWRGITFYMNITQNGHTFANRILWSDADKPLALIPGEESLAGDLGLDSGEAILAAKPLANIILVYTTRGIWQLGAVGGEEVFAASKRYDPERSSEAVLAYPRTLVSTGDTHVYAAQSAFYEYSLFEPKPKLIEWVHRASSVMFDEIDKANCAGPVAGYDAENHHLWISWPPAGQSLPQRSLVLNTQFPFSTIVDHGFTAFCQFMPREPVQILRDWL
ncbi:MAG TPA: hypothetical protein VHO25_06070, partial [Polyangiaceae bacterium]|nr:hypothetical protein [Polyangiaceae bacterium]